MPCTIVSWRESPLLTDKIDRHFDGKQRDFDTGPYISALNLILQKRANNLVNLSSVVRVGKQQYFSITDPRMSRPLPFVEARRGYLMVVRPMYKQLVVNVDTCVAAFYPPGNMADAMIAFLQHSPGGRLSHFVRMLQVRTTHLGYSREYTVRGIANTNARQTSFHCVELGQAVTLEQYFQQSRSFNVESRY